MKLVSINFVSLIFGILCFIRTDAQFNSFNNRRQVSNCVTPNNYYGTCVALSYCPEIYNVLDNVPRRYFSFLERACGYSNFNGESVICCQRPYTAPIVSTTANPFLPPSTTPAPTRPPVPTGNPFFPTRSPVVTQPPTQPPPTTRAPVITQAPITPANKIEEEAPFCRDPNGVAGACIEIRKCKPIVEELLSKPNDVSFKNFLQISNQICNKRKEAVCCPTTNGAIEVTTAGPPVIIKEIPNRPPTPAEGCGFTGTTFKKVIGGEPAKKGAWPWMALLGYDAPTIFLCGGTLVSARHVVTAAHCIRQDLLFVRLGEHDLSREDEAAVVDINVVRNVVHPDYDKRDGRADIAILYLERNVQFDSHITPICLPTSNELRSKNYVDHMPIIAGWGLTSENGRTADILQQLQIPILPNSKCEEIYKKEKRYLSAKQFDAAIVCAGVLTGGKDSCKGDSGGPLMFPETFQNNIRYYLIGVVSYGIGCAKPGIPGVYSSVQYFIDWVVEKMAEAP